MQTQSNTVTGRSPGIAPGSEIVIVDDDENMRDILTAVLSLEGFPISSFPDGETFLKRSGPRMPVCVFLDVIMPGRSGLEILKELTARDYRAPVFLISGRDDTSMVVQGLKNGAQDFLRKPFDPYSAVQRVREAVDLWSAREEQRLNPRLGTPEFPGLTNLTRRESEVLSHIIRGISSKEAGEVLKIGKRTVDNCRMSILKKLGAKNTADLVRIIMS